MTLDVAAIRSDLATILGDLGYNSFDYAPPDVKGFPAAVVGVVDEYQLSESLTRSRVVFRVTFAYNATSQEDAFRRMDAALSHGTNDDSGSVVRALQDAKGDNWKGCVVSGIEPARLAGSGNSKSIAFDLLVEIRA